MKPAKHDIEIRRGDTYELFFRVRTRVWNPTTEVWEAGAYRDLTGYEVTAQLRTAADAATVEIEFTCVLTNQTTVPGGVLVRATPAQTQALIITAGVYDVQLDPDGTGDDKYTYLEGDVTITKDVTRP